MDKKIGKKYTRKLFNITDKDMVLHHWDTTLKDTDPERYNRYCAYDVVVMSRAEHTKLHATGRKQTPEWTLKIANLNRGQKRSDETKLKQRQLKLGIKWSEETIKKRNASLKKVVHTAEWNRKVGEAQKGRNKGKTWKNIDGHRVWLGKDQTLQTGLAV